MQMRSNMCPSGVKSRDSNICVPTIIECVYCHLKNTKETAETVRHGAVDGPAICALPLIIHVQLQHINVIISKIHKSKCHLL